MKLIGYPFAAWAGMPDRWVVDEVLPSHCLSFLFLVPIRDCVPWDEYCDTHPKFNRWQESHRQRRRFRKQPLLLPAAPV